jgi:hypothetical protein
VHAVGNVTNKSVDARLKAYRQSGRFTGPGSESRRDEPLSRTHPFRSANNVPKNADRLPSPRYGRLLYWDALGGPLRTSSSSSSMTGQAPSDVFETTVAVNRSSGSLTDRNETPAS